MKHTKGNWKASELHVWSELPYQDKNGNDLGEPNQSIAADIANVVNFGDGCHKANAKLIAEAGTVTNETGFTPRQLADQKAKLLEALTVAKGYINMMHTTPKAKKMIYLGNSNEPIKDVPIYIGQVIKNAE